jgi:hypothetical protein
MIKSDVLSVDQTCTGRAIVCPLRHETMSHLLVAVLVCPGDYLGWLLLSSSQTTNSA